MDRPVVWGVLGCAGIAINQVIPAMLRSDKLRLKAVASRSMDKAQETAGRFDVPVAYGSYEDLLADPEIEAVYIPLPNHLHKVWSIAALRAGKHVLCEKPIALNAKEAREMQAVAHETGYLLLEAFAYRFTPSMQRAIALCREGTLGDLHAIHASFSFKLRDDPQNVRLRPEMGGGALYDIGCYCLNALRMFAGREPLTAFAKFTWSDIYHVDMSGAGTLDFGNQLYGTFDTGFNAPGGTFYRIVGSRGKLESPRGFHGRTQEDLLLTVDGETEVIQVPVANAYQLETEDLSEAIRGIHPPLFAWEPLGNNMAVIDACYASDQLGKSVTIGSQPDLR